MLTGSKISQNMRFQASLCWFNWSSTYLVQRGQNRIWNWQISTILLQNSTKHVSHGRRHFPRWFVYVQLHVTFHLIGGWENREREPFAPLSCSLRSGIAIFSVFTTLWTTEGMCSSYAILFLACRRTGHSRATCQQPIRALLLWGSRSDDSAPGDPEQTARGRGVPLMFWS